MGLLTSLGSGKVKCLHGSSCRDKCVWSWLYEQLLCTTASGLGKEAGKDWQGHLGAWAVKEHHHFRDTKLHLSFSLREFGLGADICVSLHQMSTSSWGDVGPAQPTH